MLFYFDTFLTLVCKIFWKFGYNWSWWQGCAHYWKLHWRQNNVRLFLCEGLHYNFEYSTKLLNRSDVNKVLDLESSDKRLSKLLKEVEFLIN